MSTSDEDGRFETLVQDLTVARRAYIRAFEKAVRLRLDLLGALKDIEEADRALKEGARNDLVKSLKGAHYA